MKRKNIILAIIISLLAVIVLGLAYINIKLFYEKKQQVLITLSILDKNIALSKYIYMQERMITQNDIDFFQMYDENLIEIKTKQAELNQLTKLNVYIYENITYKPDGLSKDDNYWQLPLETEELETGDCEDFALLFYYLAKVKLNIDVIMVWFISPDNLISHMVIEYKNWVFDPTVNKVYYKDKYFTNFVVISKYNTAKINKVIDKYRKINKNLLDK
jgi:hypothetical protein